MRSGIFLVDPNANQTTNAEKPRFYQSSVDRCRAVTLKNAPFSNRTRPAARLKESAAAPSPIVLVVVFFGLFSAKGRNERYVDSG